MSQDTLPSHISPSVKAALEDEYVEGSHKLLFTSKVWAKVSDNSYAPVPEAREELEAGVYKIVNTRQGVQIARSEIKADTLVSDKDTDSSAYKLSNELQQFWTNETAAEFEKMGILHRRGYLLYGNPGTGKSCLLKQISDNFNRNDNGITLVVEQNISLLTIGIAMIRSVEPDRKIMCIFEDLEEYTHGLESQLLAYLDGEDQVNHIINVATTNHLDNLPPRLIKRPRRFDRLIGIDPPDAKMRETFLRKKLELEPAHLQNIDSWVKISKDFTFAAMTDLVVSVVCFDKSLQDAAQSLKTLLQVQTF